MTNEIKKILNATNKCLIISSLNNDILVLPCTYSFDIINCNLCIMFSSYNNTLNNIINNPDLTLYITVCDEYQIYYLIIDGEANVSSTSFTNPTPCNNTTYQVKINILNTTCYTEKR